MLERSPTHALPPGYTLRPGAMLDRALLLKFMHRTYLELSAEENLDHLTGTVEQYFSQETPLWWVDQPTDLSDSQPIARLPSSRPVVAPIACLWFGTAIDQRSGDRHAHVFLLYVDPKHRRQGIGAALMQHAEAWAIARGDHQIGLQVFQSNQPALTLYQQLGYQVQSLWMVKPLTGRDRR